MWTAQKILVLKEETVWGRFGTDKNNFKFFVPCIMIQLRKFNKQNALFKINVLMHFSLC